MRCLVSDGRCRWWTRAILKTQYCGQAVYLTQDRDVVQACSGRVLASGKVSPYPDGVVWFLDHSLTPHQRDRLRRQGRLYQAWADSLLWRLPTEEAYRERLWELEGIITGQTLPW